jgi:hypothetical protein
MDSFIMTHCAAAFSVNCDQNDKIGLELRMQLESGNVCGQFLDPNQRILSRQSLSPTAAKVGVTNITTTSKSGKVLVKQKSLGRTLSTSVLRIKKKRSFWSNEKFKQ